MVNQPSSWETNEKKPVHVVSQDDKNVLAPDSVLDKLEEKILDPKTFQQKLYITKRILS